MRTLLRNLRTLYYCLYDHKEEIKDEDGNATGDYVIYYKPPVPLKANISTARGTVQDEVFGQNISYDKVVMCEDPDCPIDEDSVLFVDKLPEMADQIGVLTDQDRNPILDNQGELILVQVGRPIFDYVVRRAARSLNSVAYAIERADVT